MCEAVNAPMASARMGSQGGGLCLVFEAALHESVALSPSCARAFVCACVLSRLAHPGDNGGDEDEVAAQ